MSDQQPGVAIWWVRRDLRLADNPALQCAIQAADHVVPVFILDPLLLNAPDVGEKRLAFLFGGLRALDADLRARGSRLVVRRGEPGTDLAALRRETGAIAICAERDPWPYARRRDDALVEQLPLRLVDGLIVHPPGAVLTEGGAPYTVFTPFSRAWKALPPPSVCDLLPAPAHLRSPSELPSLPVPDHPALPSGVPFPPGEAEAWLRLRAFVDGGTDGIYGYADGRNRVDLDGTSRLSPYLRFGMLSARQAAVAALRAASVAPDERARKGAETWLDELIWREFYMTILYYHPGVLDSAFRPGMRDIPWGNDENDLAAWAAGRTGYPIVDAAMRQLVETGWMHNRARMIASSFLVKDLLVDWRRGERFFMLHLVDGEPAANNGGWQWTAGVGTDAAPYFRVFNPSLQSARFDPQGAYVRRWLPELARVPEQFLHEPWKMPLTTQKQAGCVLGRDYPAPIVDHAWARGRALVAYRR
jgi:deoxyribodipyrimidine photo-lyase